jgi:hypothetical protein
MILVAGMVQARRPKPYLHRKRKRLSFTLVLATLLLTASLAASPILAAELARPPQAVAPIPQPTDALVVNEFVMNSQTGFTPAGKPLEASNVEIRARLLTPLNSMFNHPGDQIKAVVSQPIAGELGRIMPVGTTLYGWIEGSQQNGRMKREGNLVARFYQSSTPDGRIELDLIPTSQDGRVHPIQNQSVLSRKQQVRRLLTTSSRIVLPLAIGSGGLSLAITAGAGTILGSILADDRRYLQGAVRGAWEGCGLSIFDPLIFKGQPARLPIGTELTLKSVEPLKIPYNMRRAASLRAAGQSSAPNPSTIDCNPFAAPPAQALLSTTARLLTDLAASNAESGQAALQTKDNPARADANPLEQIQRFLDQKNLAAAMSALDRASELYPDDPRVNTYRRQIVPLVTGRSSAK